MRVGLLGVIYVLVGIVIAATHHYFNHLGTVKLLVSALLAIVLWPLVAIGVNLHIH